MSSFTASFLGANLVAQLSGLHLSQADAATIGMFVSAFGHSGGPQLHSAPSVPGAGVASPQGAPSHQADGGSFQGYTAHMRTVAEVWWPHAACPQSPTWKLRQLADAAGLESYRPWELSPHIRPFDQTELQLLPGARFGMPDESHCRDRRGKTDVWCECYRIRRWRFPFSRAAESYEYRRTFLLVSSATWHYYGKPRYCETGVAFVVFSAPFVNSTGRWTYRYDQIDRYRQVTTPLAQQFDLYLQAYPPPSALRRAGLDHQGFTVAAVNSEDLFRRRPGNP
jgi:hypothetical protein